MKPTITEKQAVAAVLDGIMQQTDKNWASIYAEIQQTCEEAGIPSPDMSLARTHFMVCAWALNTRAAFDLFERSQAEALYRVKIQLLESYIGGKSWQAIQKAITRYQDAYNIGIRKMHNPIDDVAIMLYFQVGLPKISHSFSDRVEEIASPDVVALLSKKLMAFTGKWEYLVQHYEINMAEGRAGAQPIAQAPPGQTQ